MSKAEPTPDPGEDPQVTELLKQLNLGDSAAADRLLPVIYEELHGLAQRIMERERQGHTLQPTALIHEAFMRLIQPGDLNRESRQHFVRVAARVMRHVLVDHARAHKADKRGGVCVPVSLHEGLVANGADRDSLIAVHEALSRLDSFDPQMARIVELRFFGGLEGQEIGEAIGISERSVQRGWRVARAWLNREMSEHSDPEVPYPGRCKILRRRLAPDVLPARASTRLSREPGEASGL